MCEINGLRFAKNIPRPQFTTSFEYKMYHISKTKNRKNIKFKSKSILILVQSVSSGTIFFYSDDSKNFVRPYLNNQKKKIGKLIFLSFSEHCAAFQAKKMDDFFCRMRGGGRGYTCPMLGQVLGIVQVDTLFLNSGKDSVFL